jgi:hypothetical protein
MTVRTPRHIAAALRREAEVRPRAFFAQRSLRRAGRTGEQVLLGPFLGEIGYELEYWIPFLRRSLKDAGVPPERATVLTRGGAGVWYRDFAANAVDILELVPEGEFLALLVQRRARARDAKQLLIDPIDRELVAKALERTGPAVVVHPALMWARLRGLWFRGTPLAELLPLLEYRELEADPPPDGLPDRYVAVKAYFNQCLPDSSASRAGFRRAVERLAARTDVVLLSTGLEVDDHVEWNPGGRVHRIEHLLRPEDNLAVQTRVIAGARGLLATYGGYSYLGPFLRVPTVTLLDREADVPLHLDVLRAALPDAVYTRADVEDAGAVDSL